MKEYSITYRLERNSFGIESGVKLPISKSMALRAMTLNAAARLMGVKEADIPELPDAEDVEGLKRALNSLFAETSAKETFQCENHTGESSSGKTPSGEINIGDGGAPIRFFTALAASTPGKVITVNASESLKRRPMQILIDTLRLAGADIRCTEREGFPPLTISGESLSPGKLEIDPGVSSQYISAIMMASLLWQSDLELQLKGDSPVSAPYIAMTAGIMRDFGCAVSIDSDGIRVTHGQILPPESYPIEGDWSAASYFYEIALLNPGHPVHIENLASHAASLQGDRRCAEIFAALGVETRYNNDGSADLTCHSADLKLFMDQKGFMELDMNDTPDLVPALAPAFCMARVRFRLTSVGHLRHKESDRLEALKRELLKLGYVIKIGDSTMEWTGEMAADEIASGKDYIRIATYHDHRMAMAFAPAALRYPAVIIENPEVTGKSFPGYWRSLRNLGFEIGKTLE